MKKRASQMTGRDTLLISLDLKDKVNWDYFILLVAKTGMRFSEALALTPKTSTLPIKHCP